MDISFDDILINRLIRLVLECKIKGSFNKCMIVGLFIWFLEKREVIIWCVSDNI